MAAKTFTRNVLQTLAISWVCTIDVVKGTVVDSFWEILDIVWGGYTRNGTRKILSTRNGTRKILGIFADSTRGVCKRGVCKSCIQNSWKRAYPSGSLGSGLVATSAGLKFLTAWSEIKIKKNKQLKILLNLCLFKAFFTTFSLFYLILTDSNKLTN